MSDQIDKPLVFVPGFMGSKLWRPRRGLFLPSVLVWPLNLYALSLQLLLLEEEYPLQADGLVGHYYDGLLDFITRPKPQAGLGYKKDLNFWIFAYDWRQSCHNSGQALAKFISQKLLEANTRRIAQGLAGWQDVDIINHSMGGFVARSAMLEHAAPVNRVVYLASGHYGIAKAFFALHPDSVNQIIDDFVKDLLPGWYWDLLKASPNALFIEGWLARVVGSFQAIYELLPDQFYLNAENSLIIDNTVSPPVPIKGLEETYYKHSWQLPPPQQIRLKQAMQFKEKLGRVLPGEQNLVLYSASLPTYAYANYNGKLLQPQRLPNGDLTVTEASTNHDERATRLAISGKHTELPNLLASHAAIKVFLDT